MTEVSAPSAHDVVVFLGDTPYRITAHYGLELTCTRTAGWQLWQRSGASADPRTWTLLGGEFTGAAFRIEVAGQVICQAGHHADAPRAARVPLETELLQIPEADLPEVVRVLLAGLAQVTPPISARVHDELTAWCLQARAYCQERGL